jgi:hypothetical protein
MMTEFHWFSLPLPTQMSLQVVLRADTAELLRPIALKTLRESPGGDFNLPAIICHDNSKRRVTENFDLRNMMIRVILLADGRAAPWRVTNRTD